MSDEYDAPGAAVLSAAELMSAALDPGWSDQQPAERVCILVDLADAATLTGLQIETLCSWILTQPLPVVGVGPRDESPLASAVDLIVTSEEDLQAVVAGISRNPQASAVLVQVLRSSEKLDPIQALSVESLGYATLQAGTEFVAWLAERRGRKAARIVPPRDDMVLMTREGASLQIVLNSPDTRNSLSAAMRDALTEAFRLVAMDESIRTVDVSANGASFSSGGDLEEFGLLTDPAQAHRIRLLRMPARYLAVRAGCYRFQVHGACIGAGIEVPAFAAHLSAAPETFFQLPEVNMGLIPGAGGCVSITRRIGRQKTAFMAILNRRIGAEQALSWGLIDAIEDQPART